MGEEESALVSDSVKLSLDPNDETQIDIDSSNNDNSKDDKIVFGESLEWMGDFIKAKNCGMAIDVKLEDLDSSLSGLAQVGVQCFV
ncbi:MAG: hypothetical protein M0R38_08275 [Bacteroidia bacterium]|nr:hypothetical protein [Bacteroidia bacterium]